MEDELAAGAGRRALERRVGPGWQGGTRARRGVDLRIYPFSRPEPFWKIWVPGRSTFVISEVTLCLIKNYTH